MRHAAILSGLEWGAAFCALLILASILNRKGNQ